MGALKNRNILLTLIFSSILLVSNPQPLKANENLKEIENNQFDKPTNKSLKNYQKVLNVLARKTTTNKKQKPKVINLEIDDNLIKAKHINTTKIVEITNQDFDNIEYQKKFQAYLKSKKKQEIIIQENERRKLINQEYQKQYKKELAIYNASLKENDKDKLVKPIKQFIEYLILPEVKAKPTLPTTFNKKSNNDQKIESINRSNHFLTTVKLKDKPDKIPHYLFKASQTKIEHLPQQGSLTLFIMSAALTIDKVKTIGLKITS